MEQNRHLRKTITNLPKSLTRPLNFYALTAGAAGVGILALAEPADAEIVYTPTHTRIYPNEMVPLDLNNDGQVDFIFSNTAKAGFAYRNDHLLVITSGTNQIFVRRHATSALPAGVSVGAATSFEGGERVMVYADAAFDTSDVCLGQWKNANDRYLGFKFSIDGEVHFGWARLTAKCQGYKADGALTGYAYETVAGKAIVTGQTEEKSDGEQSAAPASETGSLGMLAAGMGGGSIIGRHE